MEQECIFSVMWRIPDGLMIKEFSSASEAYAEVLEVAEQAGMTATYAAWECAAVVTLN